ncbi:MAG: beta-L-arabinofuranosidase domain-containing protein [Candidatus Limnocylindrales bacterium]
MAATADHRSSDYGPGSTSPYRFAKLRPISSVRMDVAPGFWNDRLSTNRQVSLRHGLAQFEAAGNIGNLRLAAGAPGSYRPTLTLDADVYKWQEAVAEALASHPDVSLQRMLDDSIDLVLAAQRDDGYVNSWFQVMEPDRIFTDMTRGCELYCAGHLIEAAVAVARTTGEERYLAAARRFADRINDECGPGRQDAVDGHEEIELALVHLYRATAEPRYLALAKRFIDLRGHGIVGPGVFGPRYYQDHEPVRNATTVTGHAVRAMYLNIAATDIYLETGDTSLLAAMERQWTAMTTQKMHITGGIGTRERDEAFGEPYELPADRSYCETCAAAGLLFWSWRMLLATGDARYGDMFERVLYNSFLAGVGLDGESFFYANPLEVRAEHEAPHASTWAGETPWYLSPAPEQSTNRRRAWFPCACCPPNVMRVLAGLTRYLATQDDSGIQLHQYLPGRYELRLAEAEGVAFEVATAYPWDGNVSIAIGSAPNVPFTVSLRLPAWATDAALEVNGAPVPISAGYATVRRLWAAGDIVCLSLGMEARFVRPPERVSALAGALAIERGPLVYCIESPDHPGINLADVRVRPTSGLMSVSSDSFGGCVAVEVAAELAAAPVEDWPYAAAGPQATLGRPIRLTAIPYCLWANRESSSMRVWIPTAGYRTSD